MLNINTSKNQSTEANGALYIPTYGTITKLLPDVTQYYKNITSAIDANARTQRDVQVWTVQKEAQSYNRKTLEPGIGAWKDRVPDDLPMIHTTAAPLRWSTGRVHKLQAPRLDMRIQGSQNSPASGDANAK